MKPEQVAFFKGYRIDTNGNILNKAGALCKPYKNKHGYFSLCVRMPNKKPKMFLLHRLQALQKYGVNMYKDGIVVRHKNNDKADNSWENILIGTYKQNSMDIPEQIRIKHAKHAASFLKKYDNEAIKSFYCKTESYKKTMKEFNISSKGTLHYILNSR
jgi:hypothetical protein